MKKLVALLLFVTPLSAFTDEHGARLGKVLAQYTGIPELEAKLSTATVNPQLSDEELWNVIHLLESYVPTARLKAQIEEQPETFLKFRLFELQTRLSLLLVFLTMNDLEAVLSANLFVLHKCHLPEILTNRVLPHPYPARALPEAVSDPKRQTALFQKVAVALEQGAVYLLNSGDWVKVLVLEAFPGVQLLIDRHFAAAHFDEWRSEVPVLWQRLFGPDIIAEERAQIVARLRKIVPPLLEHRLNDLAVGSIAAPLFPGFAACIEQIVGDDTPPISEP